jgi:lysophospholipase L1-like esterase
MIDPRHQKIFTRLGILFIIVPLLLNEFVLTTLVAKEGSINTTNRVIIAVFDVFILAVGIIILANRKRLTPKRLLFSAAIFIGVVVVLEIGCHIFFALLPKHWLPDYTFPNDQIRRSYELELYRASKSMTYEQYICFRTKPARGKYINVDHNGIRKTWNPEFSGGKDPVKIWIFGGSAAWGFGARDDYTIPSHLSRYLNEKGYEVEVTNYSDMGHISGQELVRLFLLLKDGQIPDLALFYHGLNDVDYGIHGSFVGRVLFREQYREAIDNRQNPSYLLRSGILIGLREYSAIYKALYESIHIVKQRSAESSYEVSRELIDEILFVHRQNMDMVARFSEMYGFRFACFWQPWASLEPTLLDEEKQVIEDKRYSLNTLRGKEFSLVVNDSLPDGALSNFYNLSDALRGREAPVYIDTGHLDEYGNGLVAQRIVAILESDYSDVLK